MAIDPEYQLTAEERAALVAYGVTAFNVIRKIMEAEAAKFNVALLNCKPTDHAEIIAAHTSAKVAAQFCVQVINRVNSEINEFNAAQEAKKEQVLDEPFGVEDLVEGNL